MLMKIKGTKSNSNDSDDELSIGNYDTCHASAR